RLLDRHEAAQIVVGSGWGSLRLEHKRESLVANLNPIAVVEQRRLGDDFVVEIGMVAALEIFHKVLGAVTKDHSVLAADGCDVEWYVTLGASTDDRAVAGELEPASDVVPYDDFEIGLGHR